MSTAGTLNEEVIKLGHSKLLQVQTVSSPAAYVIFASVLAAPFETFVFEINNIACPIEGARFSALMSYDNGNTWIYSSYGWSTHNSYSHIAGGFTASMPLGSPYTDNLYLATQTVANAGVNGRMIFYKGNNPTGVKMARWQTTAWNPSQGSGTFHGAGGQSTSGDVNGILFRYIPSGNINSGTIRCYGLRRGT